jgi:hypothetical protein
MKVRVYACREEMIQQPVSRHHIAPLSLCRHVRDVPLEALGLDVREELLVKGSMVVSSYEEVRRVCKQADIHVGDMEYIRLELVEE